jgi:hypothetical protein
MNKNQNKPFKLLTPFGINTLKLTSILFLGLVIIQSLNKNYLEKECIKSNEKFECIIVYPYTKDLPNAIATSIISIFYLEILFKKESIREIEKIFNATEATRSIKAFYSSKKQYKHLIVQDIEQATENQEITMIGLASLEVFILADVGKEKIKENICKKGCNFKVLIIHPESSLLSCLKENGYERSFVDLSAPIRRAFIGLVSNLENYQEAQKTKSIGGIEVRLYKGMFSPNFYYSGTNINMVGMYFSLQEDAEDYPAFDVHDEGIKKLLDNHFDMIWEKSAGKVMLRWGFESTPIDKVKDFFPDTSHSASRV